MRASLTPSVSLRFFLGVLSLGVALWFLPFDAEKVGRYRLDAALKDVPNLHEKVAANCSDLRSEDTSSAAKLLLEVLAPPPPEKAIHGSCQLVVVASHSSRFHLSMLSAYRFSVKRAGLTNAFLEKDFVVKFPLPLAFLPTFAVLIAILVGFASYTLPVAIFLQIFALSGGGLISTFENSMLGIALSAQKDTNLVGLLLASAWLALYRSAKPMPHRPMRADRDGILQKVALFCLGLWNPIVFTMASTLWHPFKGTLRRLAPLLDIQFAVAALSLYLLSVDFSNFSTFASTAYASFWSPRYFTFAALLFVFFSVRTAPPQRSVPFWRMPRMGRSLGFIAGFELLNAYTGALEGFPTLTRLSLALIASELITPFQLRWSRFFYFWIPWTCCLVGISALVSIIQQSGAIDLAAALTEPRNHPSAIVVFTFVAGISLGFLSGHFATAYFALIPLMLHAEVQPLVRAALLDGILAGIMLSPISLFTVLPGVQFRVPMQQVLSRRFEQLSIPLGIGVIIYFVASFNAVAILRPITFVFLCLLFSAMRLKNRDWQFGRTFRILPEPTPGTPR